MALLQVAKLCPVQLSPVCLFQPELERGPTIHGLKAWSAVVTCPYVEGHTCMDQKKGSSENAGDLPGFPASSRCVCRASSGLEGPLLTSTLPCLYAQGLGAASCQLRSGSWRIKPRGTSQPRAHHTEMYSLPFQSEDSEAYSKASDPRV